MAEVWQHTLTLTGSLVNFLGICRHVAPGSNKMSHPPNFSALSLCCDGLRELKPYIPGRPKKLPPGLSAADIIQLASNENLAGPSPEAIRVLAGCHKRVHLYPDGDALLLKEALADAFQLATENLTVCNGSNEAIELVARCFLGAQDNAVFSHHAFAVYALVTRACGGEVREAKANPPDHAMPFGCDTAQLLRQLDARTKVIFLANPNNPTGTWLVESELRLLLDAVPANIVVLIDQAYAEYVTDPDYPDARKWLSNYPNLVVTGTFSKIHALAALRVGYAISSPEIADLMNRVRQPFNVNALAQAAACAALSDKAHVRRSVEENLRGLAYLRSALLGMGLPVLPSVANFLCFHVGSHATKVSEALLQQGVAVRCLQNYGLNSHLRVTVGMPQHNEKFVNAMSEVMPKLAPSA